MGGFIQHYKVLAQSEQHAEANLKTFLFPLYNWPGFDGMGWSVRKLLLFCYFSDLIPIKPNSCIIVDSPVIGNKTKYRSRF